MWTVKHLNLVSLSLLVTFILIPPCEPARIFGAFSMPAPSHQIIFQALMKKLAERGHEVVVASPCPLPEPKPENYKDVYMPVPIDDLKEMMKLIVSPKRTPLNEHIQLWSKSGFVCESQLSLPALKDYLPPKSDMSNVTFDLVLVEAFFMDCMVPFAHHFNAPLIAIATQYSIPWVNDMVGSPDSPAHVPHTFLPYSQNMNFLQRLHNTAFILFTKLYRRFVSLPEQDKIARKYFGPSMPPLWELEQNTSLVLTNGHPVVSPIHPTLPNLIEVGGIHVDANPPPLPKDLQDFMDEHEKIVLFSLGSLITSKNIPEDRLKIFLEIFMEVPCHFIWRWDGEIEELPVPPNVVTSKWLPQQSILAHPHLTAFITHGGLLSMLESAYHGVPLIGFPFYGDQKLNMKQATENGLGVTFDFFSFKKKQLVDTLNDVLNNTRYKENAEIVSRRFRDEYGTPLERAVFWTEYIIRHNGAPHLRAASTKLAWYQYYLVDVILTLLLASMLILIVLQKIISFITVSLNSLQSQKNKLE
ncbi:UDP-glycosyltransferase [Ladona fulva]|uniref:UDP-glucuronosyltransferase n=1 Tax=Ladona fulva TaxID=123851 RepID=A0A8K0NX17_LADFU|nr:UDP-glycosyltransferase [Ladona fulva]